MPIKFSPKLFAQDKLYGTATVGARGQVVIPVQARKELGIKPGDHLMVVGKFGKVLGLIKAQKLEKFLDMMLGFVSGQPEEKIIKSHLQKVFGEKANLKGKGKLYAN